MKWGHVQFWMRPQLVSLLTYLCLIDWNTLVDISRNRSGNGVFGIKINKPVNWLIDPPLPYILWQFCHQMQSTRTGHLRRNQHFVQWLNGLWIQWIHPYWKTRTAYILLYHDIVGSNWNHRNQSKIWKCIKLIMVWNLFSHYQLLIYVLFVENFLAWASMSVDFCA